MKIYFLLSMLLPLSLYSKGQTNKNSGNFSSGLESADYTFNIGSSVGINSNKSYFVNNYFSPSVKLKLTQKFHIVAGIGTSFTTLNNIPASYIGEQSLTTNFSQISLFSYASGIYTISPKININATFSYEKLINNSPVINNNTQYKDMSLGINYNITKHFSINAQMQLSNRPYNYYNNRIPWGSPFFGSIGNPFIY